MTILITPSISDLSKTLRLSHCCIKSAIQPGSSINAAIAITTPNIPDITVAAVDGVLYGSSSLVWLCLL